MSDTSWRESILAAVDDLPSTNDQSITISIDIMPGANGILIEAAKSRQVALAAYIRRAALAMACHDLGLPFSDALQRDGRISNSRNSPIPDPDGIRFGPWEIDRLVGEESS